MIDESVLNAFQTQGVTVLRGVFTDWIALLREGVEANMAHPGPFGRVYTPEGQSGRFFGDYCNWQNNPAYRRFVLESPAGAIAARLMRSSQAQFFHEHVLVKEPGTREITPWHHDQPYYCVDGEQTCSL